MGGFMESGLLPQGRVLLGLEFYGGLPPLSLVDMLQTTGGGFCI